MPKAKHDPRSVVADILQYAPSAEAFEGMVNRLRRDGTPFPQGEMVVAEYRRALDNAREYLDDREERLPPEAESFLFEFFSAWSEIVPIAGGVSADGTHCCEHPLPIHPGSAPSERLLEISQTQLIRRQVPLLRITLGGEGWIFAGKCPDCARVYWTRG
ncbi:MAG TPA: hypothetical protein VM490_15745 [Armatimonadaceae bacterium]|nr:hypothetical protein [Armatimonadaceae bacterium]